MKIDVHKIEQQIYFDVCKNFANWCEMQLKQYESLLKFLGTIELETMCETPAIKFYEMYVNFCNENSFEPLTRMLFAKMLSSFGYTNQKGYLNSKRYEFYRPLKG